MCIARVKTDNKARETDITFTNTINTEIFQIHLRPYYLVTGITHGLHKLNAFGQMNGLH